MPKKTTYVFFVDSEAVGGCLVGLATFNLYVTVMLLLAIPIWLPFLLIQGVAEALIIKAGSEGYILDITSQALLLSCLYIILSPSLLWTCRWCTSIYRRAKFLPLSSHIRKILKFPVRIWLASLICLPIIAFQVTGSNGIAYSYDIKTPGFGETYGQSVLDQIELLKLENQYSLHLSPSDRRKILDFDCYSPHCSSSTNTYLTGKRSDRVLFLRDFIEIEKKYKIKLSFDKQKELIEKVKYSVIGRQRSNESVSDGSIDLIRKKIRKSLMPKAK